MKIGARILLLLLALVFVTGCQESQKTWGKGDLPADYAVMFGNSNGARLNYAQTEAINKHEVLIRGIDTEKDGKKVHSNGIIDLIVGMEKRIEALEAVDPNELALEARIKTLEDWVDGVVIMDVSPQIEKIPPHAPDTTLQDVDMFHRTKINEIIDRINE